MEHLVDPSATLLIAALLLVIVGALPALPALTRGSAKARLALFVPIVAFGLGAAGVWRAFERGGVMAEGFPSQIVKYAVNELNAATEPTVLVIEGGSYVLNGVDTELVSDELEKLGFHARVVRLAAGAANHFERYRMAQDVVEQLSSKRPGQRWIHLMEVHINYDGAPLAQFMENMDASRAYHYSTLPNAWAAAKAMHSPGVMVPEGWRWTLFRHTLINTFSVGAASRYIPEAEIVSGGGRVSPHKRSRFKFRGMTSQIESLSKPARATMLPWLKDVRERRTHRLWRPYASELVYFGLPATTVEQLHYVREFCAATPRKCISPADPELLSALDDAALWRDRGHLMKRGSEIYSRWLARQLVAQQVVTH